jgi:uncharacterized protein YjbJ (UPF0337 family)
MPMVETLVACALIIFSRQRPGKARVGYEETPQQKEQTMGSTADKVKGTTNEAIGKAKQGVGNAVDSDKMKSEGAMQEAKGHFQKGKGEVKETIKKAVDNA